MDELEPAQKKRCKQLAYLESEEFQKILKAKSKHTDVLKEVRPPSSHDWGLRTGSWLDSSWFQQEAGTQTSQRLQNVSRVSQGTQGTVPASQHCCHNQGKVKLPADISFFVVFGRISQVSWLVDNERNPSALKSNEPRAYFVPHYLTSWQHEASCHLRLWLRSAVQCHRVLWRAERLGFSHWGLCWPHSQGYSTSSGTGLLSWTLTGMKS